VVPALLRYGKQQGIAWAHAQLFPLIEEEIGVESYWNKQPGSATPEVLKGASRTRVFQNKEAFTRLQNS
jgi:hypothetical protein